MAVRIPPVRFENANPQQREALEQVKAALGKVPGLYATFGQAPSLLTALLSLQGALTRGGLTARDLDLIDLHMARRSRSPCPKEKPMKRICCDEADMLRQMLSTDK